jgi:hypothetical protein
MFLWLGLQKLELDKVFVVACYFLQTKTSLHKGAKPVFKRADRYARALSKLLCLSSLLIGVDIAILVTISSNRLICVIDDFRCRFLGLSLLSMRYARAKVLWRTVSSMP